VHPVPQGRPYQSPGRRRNSLRSCGSALGFDRAATSWLSCDLAQARLVKAQLLGQDGDVSPFGGLPDLITKRRRVAGQRTAAVVQGNSLAGNAKYPVPKNLVKMAINSGGRSCFGQATLRSGNRGHLGSLVGRRSWTTHARYRANSSGYSYTSLAHASG